MTRKRQILTLIFTVIASVLLPVTALASVITNAQYLGIVRVTNNSTLASGVSVPFSQNTTQLVSLGYVSSNLSNSAIRSSAGADIAYMPAPPNATSWPLFVDSIGAATSSDYSLYLGGNISMASKIRYFPGSAGMAVPDNATLEPGANFSISLSGWVDTTAPSYSIGDFTGYTEVDTGNFITEDLAGLKARAIAATSQTDAYLYRDYGAGYFNALNVNFEIFTAGDAATDGRGGIAFANTVNDISGFAATDLVVLSTPGSATTIDIRLVRGNFVAFDLTAAISSNLTYYLTLTRAAANDTANLYIYSEASRTTLIDTLTIAGVGVGTTWRYGYGFVNYNSGIAARLWTGFIQNSTSGVTLANKGGVLNVYSYNGGIAVQVQSSNVSATVSSSERTINVSSNSTSLGIYVDAALQMTAPMVIIPNNASNWILVPNRMPYMEYASISVNGTQRGYWNWEYGATFSDDSGNGNTATPTFRTASSDPDVSAVLVSLSPITSAEATGWTVSSYGTMVTQAPTAPSGMYTELQTSTLPGNQFVVDVFGASNTPVALFWFTIPFALMVILGMLIFHASRSLLAQFGVMCIIVIAFASSGVIPYWPIYIFALDGIGLMVISKSYGW